MSNVAVDWSRMHSMAIDVLAATLERERVYLDDARETFERAKLRWDEVEERCSVTIPQLEASLERLRDS